MKRPQIDLFLKVLDAELAKPATIILTGAGAASLMGHVRPSFDIDFEIRIRGGKNTNLTFHLEKSIRKASQIAGVATNYSENIGGWSRVAYLDYRKSAVPYKRFGKLSVKILAPEYWTIGKMARFLELDIQDMLKIIRDKKIKPQRLVRIWARAIRASDLSLELGQFRDHVLYFIPKYGKQLWGPKFDPDKFVREFKRQVGRKHFIEGKSLR